MRRHVQAVLLLLTGAAVLHISLLSQVYLRYVKEGLRPFLVASAVLLLALGVVAAVRDGLPFAARPDHSEPDEDDAGDGDEHGGGDEHEHGHDHRSGPRVAWVLFLPVLALLLYAPPALGSFTAARETDNAVARVERFDPLPDADPAPLALSGFIARVQQDRDRGLAGRTVLMTGFVTPAKDRSGTWYLTRLVVSCCAADSRSLRIRVHGAPAPPADTWVAVTGTWHPGGGGALGTAKAAVAVDARTVERVPEPVNPYQDTTPLTP
ncbi:TIGR03943 family putative permease subunit [Streptomyces ficellus]|uniref:TIGR03943 family protein n=1 Tax=Streptomyces ficellus TaxID=1977088 RepID=A0A6I6F206_9ACTN|nr:TIGR03943 family protein [Streptomyces ficellus]QGV77690.1 TIGR03943 family protein [Streptomyces ficellus]